ncbi:hypothetical protein ILUMI_07623 [Ignelater luminosus]|uniref:NADP-dependent oxidoreductase domain-containing protein n=1 Tax=Ignelater luminosus TaxID=2038154 RepID=A0A8K0D905_IGNLU|nr:hypothetical protein ILUMI_07623 [Ignelater luminosus]
MDCKSLTFKLLSGQDMPLIGFGTFQIRGRSLIKDVLDWALACGYRNIDSAAVYGNEHDIGLALKDLLPKYKLKREDIFITSKLSPSDQGDRARNAVANSLQNLQCGYIDLYLIHWPGASGTPTNSTENAKLRDASWASLIKAKEEGLVKNIGVSNYMVKHLTELLNNCYGVKPAVNQVEWHPGCHEAQLKKLCQKEGILLQAYSSLGGTGNKSLLDDPLVESIAQKLNKTPAQILLRWAVQQNIAIIPKARSRERIEANISLDFVIPDEDMVALSNRKSERYAWNPHSVK